MRKMRIAFLHLAPVTSDIQHNRQMVENAVKVAAQDGADWVVTPELCIPGYMFMKHIGVVWIQPQPDEWMQGFCRLVADCQVTVFLSHPEKDRLTNKLFNTVFVIERSGEIVGRHRKVKALGGAEGWSSRGWEIQPVECDGIKAGILICADGYKNEVAGLLKERGAQVLISPVSWGPGTCGPDGEWEQRSSDTGLPMMVCNRSGVEDEELDYRMAQSVVAQNGKRILEAYCDRSVVLSFDWDMDSMTLLSDDFQRTYL